VLFAGHQADVRDYFDALDVFVFPSYANEGIPQAILQAIAYGLPIITTHAGSIKEAVSDYAGATIISPRSVNQLTDAMLAAAKEPRGRVSVPERIQNRISIDAMADHMIAIYSRTQIKA
jgi:glycosyltransferase involved in cell wall biosynthesis